MQLNQITVAAEYTIHECEIINELAAEEHTL